MKPEVSLFYYIKKANRAKMIKYSIIIVIYSLDQIKLKPIFDSPMVTPHTHTPSVYQYTG